MSRKRKDDAAETETEIAGEAEASTLADEILGEPVDGAADPQEQDGAPQGHEAAGPDGDHPDEQADELSGGADADAPPAAGDGPADEAGDAGDRQEGEVAAEAEAAGDALAPDAVSTGPEPGAADPVAASIDSDDDRPEAARPPQNGDVNALAAAVAASMAFGTTNDDAIALPRMDTSWLIGEEAENRRIAEIAQVAARFLRANPNAGDEAVRIELTRKKIARPLETPRAKVAWRVFAVTLYLLDRHDEALAQEQAAASRPQPTIDRRDAGWLA